MKEGFFEKLHVRNLKVDSINILSNTIDLTIKGSAERIKVLYESLPNTNAFTDYYKQLISFFDTHFQNGYQKIIHIHKLNTKEIPEDCFSYCYDEFNNVLMCRNTAQGIKYYKLQEYFPETKTQLYVTESGITLNINQES
jgi:hypothetical protein